MGPSPGSDRPVRRARLRYAATSVTAPGTGYTKSATDTVGDFAEYKLTNDPANTPEPVTFTNPNSYVVVATTVKPM